MTRRRLPALLRQALFDSPDLYVREIDGARHEALVLSMSRETYAESVFLDERTVHMEAQIFGLPLEALFEQYRRVSPVRRRLNVIFHTAYCGSTLLCQCLDHPGLCLPYKEPYLLHQLSAIKRRDESLPPSLSQARLLTVTLALLSRTYTDAEVPVIKPSDSSTVLARDLLAYHPASAGLLLYTSLERFLLAMLKGPVRRRYMRTMISRARKDLERLGLLEGRIPNELSDAQATGLVWMGLMYSYLDLLADDALTLRSLDAAVWFARPRQTLAAVARLFGLALTDDAIGAVVEAGSFRYDAKYPRQPFDKASYDAEQRHRARTLAGEIDEATAWTADLTRAVPIPPVLPRPLLS